MDETQEITPQSRKADSEDPMEWALTENGGDPAAPGLSVLDRLKERRDEIGQARTFDLEVPGTGGRLVLRLGALPRQRFAALTARAAKSKNPDADLNLNADTLIAATVEVLGRNSREEPLRGVGLDGQTVRIDETLAGLLGLPDATRAREVLQAVFAMAPSPDLAIGVAAGQYMEWAAAAVDDADEEFVGE
jgi:hypothetical protein